MGQHGAEDPEPLPDAVAGLSVELARRYGKRYNDGCYYPFDDREGGYGGDHWGPQNAARWRDSARGIFSAITDLGFQTGRVLDLGCGRGVVTTELRALGVRAFGLDIGSDVKTAGAVGNALAMPFADQSFDTIVALDIIEHVPMDGQPRLWWELRRLGAGLILATVPAQPPHYARFSSDGVYNHYVALDPAHWASDIFLPGGFTVLAAGERLARHGPPFSHGQANYPFALVPVPREGDLRPRT